MLGKLRQGRTQPAHRQFRWVKTPCDGLGHRACLVGQVNDVPRCLRFGLRALGELMRQGCAEERKAGQVLAQAIVQLAADGLLLLFTDANQLSLQRPAFGHFAPQI